MTTPILRRAAIALVLVIAWVCVGAAIRLVNGPSADSLWFWLAVVAWVALADVIGLTLAARWFPR